MEAAFSKEKEQQELMLQLQIKLDTLMQKNNATDDTKNIRQNNELFKKKSIDLSKVNNTRPGNNVNTRAQTAPIAASNLLTASQRNDMVNERAITKRTVNSSPALFTLERIMQSFRARSQILAETLEENDNVMQKRNFGSTLDISTDVLTEVDENITSNVDGDNDEVGSNFTRKNTFKVNKAETRVESKPMVGLKQNIGNNKENVSHETQKKLRDMSINIR